jgi:anti-sigma factor ChrR (cupin superfamily)
MIDDDDIDAALFAAGALTADETEAARAKLKRDLDFAAKTQEWEALLAPLAAFAPDVAPPDDLLGKIETRLDARAKTQALSRTLRAAEGDWIVVGKGMRAKILHEMPELGRQTVLMEFAPGAVYPPHDHDQDEEIFMISGDLAIGGEELGPGDFHVSRKGSCHPATTTRLGCRCIISLAM